MTHTLDIVFTEKCRCFSFTHTFDNTCQITKIVVEKAHFKCLKFIISGWDAIEFDGNLKRTHDLLNAVGLREQVTEIDSLEILEALLQNLEGTKETLTPTPLPIKYFSSFMVRFEDIVGEVKMHVEFIKLPHQYKKRVFEMEDLRPVHVYDGHHYATNGKIGGGDSVELPIYCRILSRDKSDISRYVEKIQFLVNGNIVGDLHLQDTTFINYFYPIVTNKDFYSIHISFKEKTPIDENIYIVTTVLIPNN